MFRSIAILLVLTCHFSNCGLVPGPLADRARNVLAIYGVELFFVLSGFLIGSILIRDFDAGPVTGAKLKRFSSRRWLRTLPNYFVYLPVGLILERACYGGTRFFYKIWRGKCRMSFSPRGAWRWRSGFICSFR